jgi:hypothetical protein
MPPGVEDRAADVWEPLLAIADGAGGDWPRIAREAAVTFVTEARDTPATLGVRLLADIRASFGDDEHMATTVLLDTLNGMEEAPWGDLRGKPLDARKLARMLHPYGIKPQTIRRASGTAKGYRREDLSDAWERYLSLSSAEGVTSVTGGTAKADGPDGNAGDHVPDVTDVTDVTDFGGDREAGHGWIGESPEESAKRRKQE